MEERAMPPYITIPQGRAPTPLICRRLPATWVIRIVSRVQRTTARNPQGACGKANETANETVATGWRVPPMRHPPSWLVRAVAVGFEPTEDLHPHALSRSATGRSGVTAQGVCTGQRCARPLTNAGEPGRTPPQLQPCRPAPYLRRQPRLKQADQRKRRTGAGLPSPAPPDDPS
jgi:hypothetical protein